MKNRVLIALSLASVLSVAAPAVSAFAAAPATESSQEAPTAENGTESSGEKSRGKRGEKPSNADGTTDGTVKEGCGKHGKKEEVAEPENAIGKDAAKEKALADAGIAADTAGKVRARLSTLEDGTVVYKVKFTVDSQKYSYKIDAVSGNVVDKSAETVTEEEAAKEGHKHGKKEEVAEPENAIGKDAAKEKVLADAGIAADAAGKVRSRLSTLEDGTVVYKVKFTVDTQKYSYKIDAVSGNIVDKSTETVSAEDEAKEGRGHGKRGGMKNEASETEAATETTTV